MNARGSSVYQCSPDASISTIRSLSGSVFADAVVLHIRENVLEWDYGVVPGDPYRSWRIAEALRKLPDYCAMSDGRKWSRLPIFYREAGIEFEDSYSSTRTSHTFADDIHLLSMVRDLTRPYRRMRRVVWNYYRRVMDDYEDVGLMATEEDGRLRVMPALRARAKANGRYYYGPADHRAAKWFTIARDFEADAEDLERFKHIIDPRNGTKEGVIHRFLAETPHYLSTDNVDVISHPRFDPMTGRREFDFVLRPYVERNAPGSWSVIEIKRADQSIFSGLGSNDPIFAGAVFRAVNQVRNYRRFVNDPANRDKVLKTLGTIPEEARLAVLIGRRSGAYLDLFEQQRRDWCADVLLITYDDLYDVRERALALA
jgi:hypothetical protein